MATIVDNTIKWYKNQLTVLYIILIFNFLLLLSTFSTNTRLSLVQQKQLDIEKRIDENTTAISNINDVVKTTVEHEFTKNLLYTDAIQKGKLSTQDIQKRLNDLNNKLKNVK